MQPYKINLSQIEEFQTIQNRRALDAIFRQAKSTLVNGETVWLTREGSEPAAEKLDEITTLSDLETYKKSVYKYL